ncbi:MAG: FCD domain-containing protein [Rhodospirillales bacterium]
MDAADGALTQLKAWLAQRELPPDGRLPPERELCDILGVSRGDLRKALAMLERNGELWRRVGKGTFIGAKPVEELSSIATVAQRSNPVEVMKARLLVEPMLTREAAVNATGAHIEEMYRCITAQREAMTWRQYENADNRLHRTIAEATCNTVLIALFDQLNAVRRAVVWGRLREKSDTPPPNHHSFAEHDRIVSAIAERDQDAASRAMYDHLSTVRDGLLLSRSAAE